MFNYIKVVTFVMVAVLFASCSDFLEEEIHTEVSNTRYSTPAGFTEAVNSAYSYLRTFYGTEEGLSATVFGTDTYREGADGGWKHMNRYNQELDSFDDVSESVWNNMYRGINITNSVLARAEGGIEGISPEIVERRSAEVRFLRAHYYFILVQLFGPVHFTIEETEGVELEASRTPIDVIYDQIIADLDFAINTLPPEAEQYGRATKPAAEHLLARVYLTRATSTAGESGDYQSAADLAETVIDDYNFQLLEDFEDVFAVGNEQNAEVIWAVQYSENALANETPDHDLLRGGNSAHLYFNFPYDQEPGLFRVVEFGRPFRRFRPTEFATQEMFNVNDRDIDSRYKKSFKDAFRVLQPGTYTIDDTEKTLAEGDTAIWLPGVNMDIAEQQTYNMQVITPDEYNSINFPPLWKFMDPNRADINVTAGSRDWMAFRLAETHLIAAEAHYYLANETASPEAVAHLNEVRARAAWPGEEANMTSTTAADLNSEGVDYILDERGRELIGEQFRWFDLVRTGKLVERVSAHNPDAVQPLGNVQECHELRPIPQDQIDRTEGGFGQNECYE